MVTMIILILINAYTGDKGDEDDNDDCDDNDGVDYDNDYNNDDDNYAYKDIKMIADHFNKDLCNSDDQRGYGQTENNINTS